MSGGDLLTGSVIEPGLQSAAKKAGESALNGIIKFIKDKYGKYQIQTGEAFERYLENAYERLNRVKTLATGFDPVPLIGEGGIYVNVGVSYKNETVPTDTVDALMEISNNILITGTGGIGKSMLMRYLFLNTREMETYVPVFVQLRKVSNQKKGEVSVLKLIFTCMADYDVKMPEEQFEYSLRNGGYLFLLDGFDEISNDMVGETAERIQEFCAKYPNNACIITSRPENDFTSLQTFHGVEAMPLTKEQAVELAEKLHDKDEKTVEFCKQLENKLYKQYKDFAENPLLLTIMFITFMHNNSIPDSLPDFYSRAFDALYNTHDSRNKGNYKREFKCKNLSEVDFRTLFADFCFRTYYSQKYEFAENEIIGFLEQSFAKQKVTDTASKDYLKDLMVLCLIVRDGNIYTFSHRSFQEYFAAVHTEKLSDESQKKLFVKLMGKNEVRKDFKYYKLLNMMMPKRFAENAVEPGLRELVKKLKNSKDPYKDMLYCLSNGGSWVLWINSGIFFTVMNPKTIFGETVDLFDALYYDRQEKLNICNNGLKKYVFHIYNIVNLDEPTLSLSKQVNEELFEIISKVTDDDETVKNRQFFGMRTKYSDIDESDKITEEERKKIYDELIRAYNIPNLLKQIHKWLDKLDAERAAAQTVISDLDFIDSL